MLVGVFQRRFLDVLDVFFGLLGGVHAAHEGVGEFGAVDLKSIEHAGEALLHLGSAEVQEAVDQDYSTKFGGAYLVDIGEDIGYAVRPAEEDDAGQVQVLEEFVDVAGVACRVIPFRSFLGVSLGTRIEGNDAEVGGEVVDLGLEDFGGHGPAGDEDDGRGLGGAGVEIVEGDVVGSEEGFAFGVDGGDGAGGEERETDECQGGSHEDGNFSRIGDDSEPVATEGVLRLTEDLDAPTLVGRT